MCAVSFVGDHYFQRPQQGILPKPIPWPTFEPRIPWTKDTWGELKTILQRLDDLDRKLGLAKCEDPKKLEWMKAVEKRLVTLEQPKKQRTQKRRAR